MNPINDIKINDIDSNKFNKNQNKHSLEKNNKVTMQKEKINVSLHDDKKLDRQIERVESNEAEALDLETLIKPEKSHKQTSISEKSEGFYNCIGRKKDKSSGGYFYIFEVKKEFQNLEKDEENNAIIKVLRELYPATQVDPVGIDKYLKQSDLFRKLGFEKNGDHLIFPDEKILNSRWLNLKKDNPYLHPLNLISSDGIADDKSFIEAIKQGNIIISNGPEFLHDHFFHVMPRILLLSNHEPSSIGKHYSEYRNVMNKFNREISKIMILINEKEEEVKNSKLSNDSKKEQEKICEILWTCLGLIVDKGSTCETLSDMESFPGTHLLDILLVDKPYLTKRYGEFIENNKSKLLLILKNMYRDAHTRF
ncbi:MAG: hypothetical protein Q8K60_07580 [Parachlamydiaceae bacterium]|nr:hypothetical protein [Parachlamydiaceae bacterium]